VLLPEFGSAGTISCTWPFADGMNPATHLAAPTDLRTPITKENHMRLTGKKLIALTGFCFALSAAYAGSIVFVPNPKDLGDLDHNTYVSWGIDYQVPAHMKLVDVILRISNIDDWTDEADDHLYIHLLDQPPIGVVHYNDSEKGGDNWAGKGPLIADYSDPGPGKEPLEYGLKKLGLLETFKSYALDGRVGVAFDPDCHYYNDGVSLEVITEPVPEPASGLAAVTGIGLLIGALRRRSSR
jgi:hypothetical protein